VLQIGGGLDLGQEPFGTDHGGQLGPEDLDRHLAVVLEVLGEVHRGHAALAQLPLDAVAVCQGDSEACGDAHVPVFFSRALSSAPQLSTTMVWAESATGLSSRTCDPSGEMS